MTDLGLDKVESVLNTFLSKINDESLEHCFINSAYLSELWAANDIAAKISSGLISKIDAQEQLDDEHRHADLLFKMMRKLGFSPSEDINFSMQNVLYKSTLKIDLSATNNDLSFFWGAHEVTEKRAIFNYKSYLLGGTIDSYKKILRVIINDERGHFKKINLKQDNINKIFKADKFLHRVHLYNHYNKMNLLRSKSFWIDYFSDNITPIPASTLESEIYL